MAKQGKNVQRKQPVKTKNKPQSSKKSKKIQQSPSNREKMQEILESKEKEYIRLKEKYYQYLRIKMYRSAAVTFLIALVFFIPSALFVSSVIEIPSDSTTIDVLILFLKTGLNMGFFLFFTLSLGNLLEARGYRMEWKHLLLPFFLSIMQTVTEAYLFLLVLLGNVLILTYLYFLQPKADEAV